MTKLTLEKEITGQKQDQVDWNDYLYVADRLAPGVQIVSMEPAPWSKGRLHFNATNFYVRKGKEIATTTVFHVKPIYYVNRYGARRPLGEILSHHGNRKMQLNENWENADFGYIAWLVKRQAILKSGLMMPYAKIPLLLNTVTTKYPDPDPETATVDGWILQTYGAGSGVAWATIIGLADGTSATPSGASGAIGFDTDNVSNQWKVLRRFICLFDTSSIPDTDTISAGVLSLWGTAKTDEGGRTPNIDIYTSSPASNTDVTTADFDQVGSTSQTGSPITFANWLTTPAYNDFTFDATGRGNISKTGVSKFGARNQNYDAAASAPTWGSDQQQLINFAAADTADTTNDPKLVVTHAASITSGKRAAHIAMLRVG